MAKPGKFNRQDYIAGQIHAYLAAGQIMRPSRNRQEYHGNGPGSWRETEIELAGHRLTWRSVRHSYRWHKTIVLLDGRQLRTAADYRRAEAAIGLGQ